MNAHQDNDAILDERIRTMGPELGRIVHDLWAQLIWLNAKWRIHQDLFASDESQTHLMESIAVQTFNQIYAALTNEVIMHICRITDAAKTNRFTNATIWQLPQLVSRPDDHLRVEALVAEADSKCQFARGTRDKFLAHRDLNAALYPDTLPRDRMRAEDVQAALAAIAAVLNAVEVACGGATVRYDINAHFSDADRLIRVMRDGAKAQADARRHRGFEMNDSES